MDYEARIEDLLSKMTLEEKASQTLHSSAAVERLDIPEYNWWNECLHGVARAGMATIFPQAIGLAATFDEDFILEVAKAISDEARAKYNEFIKKNVRGQYQGLTFWTPNINIFRDPRWGRGQETYGEDPFLTGRIGLAFVKGLQGDHPEKMKVAACAKHFAVHSGPEKDRHVFDAVVNPKDLWETYLPAFELLVKNGVEAVMGAYNRTLGEPCCGSKLLMEDILRDKWQFQGHYVSDCWAIRDFHEHHKVTSRPEESVALALNKGCDLNCGCTYEYLVKAVKEGLVSEETLDTSVRRLLRTRFKLGMFDNPAEDPWKDLDASVVNCDSHRQLARKAAEKSVVLLRNKNNLLPLDGSKKRLLLIGPAAANLHTLTANYHGLSSRLVTLLEGVTAKVAERPEIHMDYTQGCMMYGENRNTGWTLGMAEAADVVIAAFGLDNAMEGEEGDAIASDSKGDRKEIELPQWQRDYLKELSDRGTPIILVLTGGSAIAIPEEIADAVLFAWYPGEEGGNALADIIFGDVNPSGKLPVTFPASTDQLPDYEDYSMQGRTYRYMTEEPLYPFGFGLSYTQFHLNSAKLSSDSLNPETGLELEVNLSNRGQIQGDEVVQIYVRRKDRAKDEALCSLRAFKRVSLEAGEQKSLSFSLAADDFMTVNDLGDKVLIPGDYEVVIADCAPVASAERKGAITPIVLPCKIEE